MQLACDSLSKMSITIMLQHPSSAIDVESIDEIANSNIGNGMPATHGDANSPTNIMAIPTLLNPPEDTQGMAVLAAPGRIPVLPPMKTEPVDKMDVSYLVGSHTTSRHSIPLPIYPSLTPPRHNPSDWIQVDEHNFRTRTSKRPRTRSKSTGRSNKPYTREQVDFIRYFKEDCRISFADLGPLFMKKFPDTLRETDQCFSSRYYRANIVPRRDQNGRPTFDDEGKVVWDTVKIRSRYTLEGERLSIPYTLVDMYPWRAVKYNWVSEEHKRVASLILHGIDPTDPSGSMFPNIRT
ncbi:hypothetical protein B0O99DRAFT_678179 [Bisporella sp. PMI_857]|nr:hypothetical protein B0O99DRAFT_678179 [Bisporella sp. PMI_857]